MTNGARSGALAVLLLLACVEPAEQDSRAFAARVLGSAAFDVQGLAAPAAGVPFRLGLAGARPDMLFEASADFAEVPEVGETYTLASGVVMRIEGLASKADRSVSWRVAQDAPLRIEFRAIEPEGGGWVLHGRLEAMLRRPGVPDVPMIATF